MFAFEIPGQRFSMPAGADVERFRFVSINEASEGVPATGDVPVVGVSMNKAALGEVLEIADGIVMVEAGDAVTAGAAVWSDAEGRAIVPEEGMMPIITALTAATAAGEIITVKL